MHCPRGNATDTIWRVLASSEGISSWTPLKPQHTNPNPLANQLWCIDFLTPLTPLLLPHRLPGFFESLMPLKNWWSICKWQGWGCGLVHCPGGNATDPIWRVLASSEGISSWTSLKPQHTNPNPNTLANQLWCIDSLLLPHLSSSLTNSLPSLNLLCHSKTDSCKMLQKQSEAFHTFLWHFFQV